MANGSGVEAARACAHEVKQCANAHHFWRESHSYFGNVMNSIDAGGEAATIVLPVMVALNDSREAACMSYLSRQPIKNIYININI